MIRFAALAAAAMIGCRDSEAAPADSIRVVTVARGLSSPVYLTAPVGDPRLFVVEQQGRIRVIKDGQLLTTPYIDLREKVRSGGERGLLGLAFHPSFATNGYFYVKYTDRNGDNTVERYHATPSSDVADPASATHVLTIDQPYANHNGGMVLFGPDGMLWIGTGDGGSGGDPHGNGQKLGTLLGKMLRIDVDRGTPYTIPRDNPFVGRPGARAEIWAYGLRNPWRYAFDTTTGLLYIADVGQNEWEEVDVAPANRPGLNYGWNRMEGKHCYGSSTCDRAGLEIPVLEYGHNDGCSITGGFVYRGTAMPAVQGHYFYSDWCTGFLRSFKYVDGTATEMRSWNVGSLGAVLSFGQDAAGELYILSDNGTVKKIVPN